MATALKISKTKGGITRSFIFEYGEISQLRTPAVSQKASLGIPKNGAADDVEDISIDLGVKKEMSFSWRLLKQTTDRAEGTNTTDNVWDSGGSLGTVEDYQEMLDFLEYVIAYPGIGDVDYEITITDKFRTRVDKYKFEDFDIDTNSGIYPSGTFKFSWIKRVVS